jgi:hypothetical protein
VPSAEAQVVNVRTDRIVGSLVYPVFVTHAPGDTSRLFIVLKGGSIRIFDLTTNTLLPTPFLSVTVAGGTSVSDERGLLGLAFDPGYAKNGQFYIYYTGTNTNVLARYTRSAANPNVANAAGNIMMSWSDPFSNHNGGWIGFGPDANLYIGEQVGADTIQRGLLNACFDLTGRPQSAWGLGQDISNSRIRLCGMQPCRINHLRVACW